MMMRTSLAACLVGMTAFAASNPVTFNKDVLPVLQKNCQECHRPGEVAPMSLLTYSEARPWAKAMKAAVLAQKMPPWFADPQYGHFANDRRLSQEEIGVLTAWADNGAPEGDARDKPAPREFPSGWQIKPDMVIEMPEEFHLPATGTINYQYTRVKGNITKDIWVTAAEMRPGNPKVVHHGKLWVLPPGSKWMADAMPGKPTEGRETGKNDQVDGNDVLGKFNPGLGGAELRHRRLGKTGAQRIGLRFRTALHCLRHSHDGSLEGRPGAGEGAAADALLSDARYTVSSKPGDSSGRQQRRGGSRRNLGRRRKAGVHSTAHAFAREGLRTPPDLSGRPIRNCVQRSVGLQLAVGLRSGRSHRRAQGYAHRNHRAFR